MLRKGVRKSKFVLVWVGILENLGNFSGNLGWMNRCLDEDFKGTKTTDWASLVVDFRNSGIRIFSGKVNLYKNNENGFFWVILGENLCLGIFSPLIYSIMGNLWKSESRGPEMDQREKYVKCDKFDGKNSIKNSNRGEKVFLEIFSFAGNWVGKWRKMVGEWKGKMRTAAI